MKEFFFAICLLSSIIAFTQPGPQISTQGALVLDQFLQSKTTSGQVPGIVALVLNKEKVIYKSASGFSRISTKESMAADKIFSIASMTKAVTTVAAMQLIEQGKIDLNDPVSKYLPAMGSIQVIEKFNPKDTSYSLRSPARPITIRDLLTHTSGSGYSFDDKTLALISQKKPAIAPSPHTGYPLIHDPGARWTYGMNTNLLGEVIEKVSGLSLVQYFDANIFKPLGIDDTSFIVPEAKYSRLARSYTRINNKLEEQVGFEKRKPAISGGNGLYSTAGDYAIFLRMLLNKGALNGKRIVSEKSVTAMTQNQIGDLFVNTLPGTFPRLALDFPERSGKDKFGFGFVIRTASENEPNTRKPGSYSWAGIFNTHYWVDPQTGIAVVFLMQVLPFYDPGCMEALDGFERVVYGNLDEGK